MHIFVEPGSYSLQNVGDAAMLQLCVRRLREVWRGAEIAIATASPGRLARVCPGTLPVPVPSTKAQLIDPALLGRGYRLFPAGVAHRLRGCERRFAARHPLALLACIRLKSRLRGTDASDLERFASRIADADLVVASGAGGLNDAFEERARTLLATLDLAAARGVPVAMFSQGIGPLRHGPFRDSVAATLRRVALIGTRERVAAPPLLASMSLDPERVVVTGDDAIELAYEARPASPGGLLGINLRAAAYAGTDATTVAALRPVLHRVAARLKTDLLPVPISHRHDGLDARTNRALLADKASDGGIALDTPDKVIRQVGRCRAVVAGSYHAAVFALAQGIPAVALVNSAYYADKFRGLADMFGGGCETVGLDDPALSETLPAAIERAWRDADAAREGLLAAAAAQMGMSRQAYARLGAALAVAARADRGGTAA